MRIMFGGRAVERQQWAVEVGSTVAEQPPGVTQPLSIVELERGGEHGLAVATGFGDFVTGGVGDERRAVERDLVRRAPLVAGAVGGDRAA